MEELRLAAARRHWGALAPSAAALFAVALFHALTITSARFRIPVEPIGLAWGAVGFMPAVAAIAHRVAEAWKSARRPPPGDRGANLRGPHVRPAQTLRRRAG